MQLPLDGLPRSLLKGQAVRLEEGRVDQRHGLLAERSQGRLDGAGRLGIARQEFGWPNFERKVVSGQDPVHDTTSGSGISGCSRWTYSRPSQKALMNVAALWEEAIMSR